MNFARRVFFIAGIYGLIVLVPHFFMERFINQKYPPAITHPEYYYGFVGIAVAWQVAFLMISRDPARYRALMIPAILEKLGFGVATLILIAQQRSPAAAGLGAGLDLILLALFVVAYWKTRAAAVSAVDSRHIAPTA